jgi:hypothetical protein
VIRSKSKFVLSVIALALSTLAIENANQSARADSGVTKVAVCDVRDTTLCFHLTENFNPLGAMARH